MIPILYKADAVDFSTFGIGSLSECTLCEVTEERNGAFECTLKYPVTGRMFAELKNERLIKAKPNDTSKEQLFRIYRITTPINGIVTIYAQHISYDLSNIAELMWSSAMISPSLAMSRLFTKTATTHKFKCSTDFSSAKPFSVSKPKSVRACLGGSEGSMLDLWGGEYEWDNFKVILHTKRGKDNGVVIEYGKNLTDMEQDNDFTDVYTDILPYAVFSDESTEKVVTLSEVTLPIVDTPLRSKTLIKDFTEYFEDKASINENSLRNKAKNFIKANPLGVETPTLTVAFEPLWKQPEYSAILERVSLCDTVTIRHSALGITAKSKVIKTVYDSLAEKYVSITLGTAKSNFVNTVGDIKTELSEVKNRTEHFPLLINTAVKNATSLITGQNGGYVVINTNSVSGQPYELLILDAPTIESAVNVWRWNVGGLGFSKNGYNGPYETAITSNGQIVADFITSGTPFEYNVLSAGEKEVVDILLDLYLRKDEYTDSIYIIDEPELHLNTAIQRKLLIEINKMIPDNCQIWVATHSIGFLRALQDELNDMSQIIEFKEENKWASQAYTLVPMVKSRNNWRNLFATALDDLTGLVSPKRIVYCEGRAEPTRTGEERGFDAEVFNSIFGEKYPDTLFISSGGNTELDQRSEIAISILSKVFSDVEILVLKDRDMASGKETTEEDRQMYLSNNPENHRVLNRFEIENYLYDKEVLKKYCEENGKIFDEAAYDSFVTDIINQHVKDSTGRIRNFCGIVGSINAEVFKKNLAKVIDSSMQVYNELERVIFQRA